MEKTFKRLIYIWIFPILVLYWTFSGGDMRSFFDRYKEHYGKYQKNDWKTLGEENESG